MYIHIYEVLCIQVDKIQLSSLITLCYVVWWTTMYFIPSGQVIYLNYPIFVLKLPNTEVVNHALQGKNTDKWNVSSNVEDNNPKAKLLKIRRLGYFLLEEHGNKGTNILRAFGNVIYWLRIFLVSILHLDTNIFSATINSCLKWTSHLSTYCNFHVLHFCHSF